jgi:nucleoside-diphosphate-sugar epimerase
MTLRRVLVTGASGFIGRWSVPALLRLGYEVHCVVSGAGREPPAGLGAREPVTSAEAGECERGTPAETGEREHGARAQTGERERGTPVERGEAGERGVRRHVADLLNAASIQRLVAAVRPSHLLHFAWVAAPGIFWTSADNERWRHASESLLEAFVAAGGRRAVMAGSCAEYDWSRAGVCDEFTTPLVEPEAAGVTPYAAAKRRLQRHVAALDRTGVVSAAWARVFFQFGPHEHPQRLVASVIARLLENRPAECTHGRQIRSFLHVADVGEAFARLLDSGLRGPVNIGSAERVSIADLVRLIGVHAGRPELIRLGARTAPPDEPALLVPAVERLHAAVTWRPRFTLDSAIADTLAWHRRRALTAPLGPP